MTARDQRTGFILSTMNIKYCYQALTYLGQTFVDINERMGDAVMETAWRKSTQKVLTRHKRDEES